MFSCLSEVSSICHLFKVFVWFNVLEFVQNVIIWTTVNSVNFVLTINDLWHWIVISWETWVVDIDCVSIISIGQYPMTSASNVANDDFSLIELWFDKSIWNFSFKADTQTFDWSPKIHAAIIITSVVSEPGVETSGIPSMTSCGQGHGCRRHQASRVTNSITRSSKLVISPSWVTLLEKRIWSAKCEGQK